MMSRPKLFRALLCGGAALVALGSGCSASAEASSASSNANNSHDFETIGAPAGFDDLAQPREVLVDIYFGGRKVGNGIAVARPGFLQFRDPQKIAALVPNLTSPRDLGDALSGDLATHADRICGQSNHGRCGDLATQAAGIIFDEGRFRVDLFVPPAMLRAVPVSDQGFLAAPASGLSLTSNAGLTISGTRGHSPSYNVQDRTIVAFGAARVRTDMSYSSGLGLLVDNFAGELDRRDLRYSAGLFWAPGLDLTGRRRIVGVGVGTQFDTRADKESINGTPLILFLTQPARVDFLIDGRLAGSRAYDAGNNILDTSGLPEGSYPVVLKIHGVDGTEREERRFFVKTPQVAPVGHPLYFAYAGMLANTKPDRLVSISNLFYYQAGTARRLSEKLAVDLSLVGTQKTAMAEAGGWLMTPLADVRAAGLVSTSGDVAALVQGSSNGKGAFNFAFDLRRIWSHNDRPLIPLPTFIDSFGGGQPAGSQIGGSYLQASATVGYRLGPAYLSVIGSIRKDAHRTSDYSVGPSVTWPVFNAHGLQMTLQADAQRTRTTTSAFAGIRMIYSSNRLSVNGDAGYASTDNRGGGGSRHRAVGGLSANYFYEDSDRTQVSAGGGVERSIDSTVAHAGVTAYSALGNARADVLDDLEGDGGLQYGLTVQSAIAMGGGKVAVGARDLDDSAVIVTVGGETRGSSFRVMVNNMPYGHVEAGGQLAVHLQPYRAYEVRLLPEDAAAVTFDADSKTVTLYPGTVQTLRWNARTFFTAFGQAVSADGRPLANFMVQAPHSVGETDENGYFQVDGANGDVLAFNRADSRCTIKLDGLAPTNDFVSLGKMVCK